MSVGLTKDVEINYTAEANYAGGKAGIKYAKTVSTTAADFTAFNYPKGEQTMPFKEYEREKIRAAGQALDQVQTFNKAYKYKESTMKVYPQSAVWLDMIIAGTAGAIPTSYYIKYKQPTKTYDVFGCILTKYEFHAAPKEFAEETLTWNYYEVDEGTDMATDLVFLTTQPIIFKDVEFKIGATIIADLTDITLTIERELLDEMAPGKYQRMDPVLVKRSTTVKATFYDASDAILVPLRTETAVTNVTLTVDMDKLAVGTSKTFTATNMVLEEANTEFIPEFGLYKYEVTFVNGGLSVLGAAA